MIHFEQLVLAVMTAVAAAYMGNRLLQTIQSDGAVYTSVPWWEEMCKTGAALLFDTTLVGVHILFGLTEFLYDLLRPSIRGFVVGGMTFLGHLTFGYLTQAVAGWTGSILWGYAAASVCHMIWNRLVLRLIVHLQAGRVRGGHL